MAETKRRRPDRWVTLIWTPAETPHGVPVIETDVPRAGRSQDHTPMLRNREEITKWRGREAVARWMGKTPWTLIETPHGVSVVETDVPHAGRN